jgi:hypothetical protein
MLSANGIRARLGLEVFMFDGLRLSVAAAALTLATVSSSAARFSACSSSRIFWITFAA